MPWSPRSSLQALGRQAHFAHDSFVKLPGAAAAVVDAAKVRDYLLSPDHPVGHAKARFFTSLGFTQGNWPLRRKALLRLAHETDAELGPETAPLDRSTSSAVS